MPWLRESWHRARTLIHRPTVELRLEEEIAFHVDQQLARTSKPGWIQTTREDWRSCNSDQAAAIPRRRCARSLLATYGLVAIAALASCVPAHTATIIDPVPTLRGE